MSSEDVKNILKTIKELSRELKEVKKEIMLLKKQRRNERREIVITQGEEDIYGIIEGTLKEVEEEIGSISKATPEEKKIKTADKFKELERIIDNIDPAQAADALGVLANSDRIRLLQILRQRERYFGELEEILHMGPSSLRHHLSRLQSLGFVVQERSRGKYLITPRGIAALILLAYLYRRVIEEYGIKKILGDEK
ncbi:MAG: ArsR family transcriptional regulator [Candidatus Njordarchaeia archaeon]|nr:ArsR family transcriptional regulator [Candidatus Korarchaeota archaeon]